MSLKDRLNLNTEQNRALNMSEENLKALEFFEKLLETEQNILICCPIEIQTYDALNFLCNKLPKDKRTVTIGSNLNLNQNEVIKFEPDTQNSSKDLIKTSLGLNPDKIILQNFQGVEAADIFKLVNADIKNIITAITASNAKKALVQAEFNLYSNGVSIPENIMKKMMASFIGKIIEVKTAGKNKLCISKILEIKSVKNNEYVLSEIISTNKKPKKVTDKFDIKGFDKNFQSPSAADVQPDILKKKLNISVDDEIIKKSRLVSKLKRKRSL